MNKLKHRSMITKIIVAAIIIFAIITGLTGCGAFESAMQDVKGSLIGDSYTVYFYDDYGAQFLTMEGDRIDMEGNYVLVDAHDPEMEDAQKMELSSVITITIDGHEVDTTGSTVIFEGSGIYSQYLCNEMLFGNNDSICNNIFSKSYRYFYY